MELLERYLQPLLSLFGDQPYIRALVIVVITLTLARLFASALILFIKVIASRTETLLDDAIFGQLSRPLIYSIIMIGLSLAARQLPVTASQIDGIISVLQTIGILVWMVFFIRTEKILLRHQSEHSAKGALIRPATLPLFENIAIIVIIAFAIYLIFNTWGIDMTAWLASAGIIGIAVGFAAKDTLANLFSGVFILADMPYKIGDYIVLDSGERGKVTQIGIRSTRMLTRDDVELTIPNSIMGNSKIVNQSGGPYEKFRIRIPVGVAYGSDVDHIRTLLMDVAKTNKNVCNTPKPRVRFRVFGASSLDFELLCWIDAPALRGRVTDSLLTQIYKRFNTEDIEIPYTKQDLYIRDLPKAMASINAPGDLKTED
ncbi:MAG TPA: mechanosensitive ion channel family protein [Gammaproteobacteria bacterium]|nr:mechanosensitive ion channel family protein [Gammaproteobacteria bacterium]